METSKLPEDGSIKDLVDFINNVRRDSRGKWFQVGGTYLGKTVQIKCFKTWAQILRIDGVKHECPMDAKVTEFKKALTQAFEYHTEDKDNGKT